MINFFDVKILIFVLTMFYTGQMYTITKQAWWHATRSSINDILNFTIILERLLSLKKKWRGMLHSFGLIFEFDKK